MKESRLTNVDEFNDALNVGIFKEKMGALLSDVALGTVVHGDGKRKGKVNIEFTFTQVGEHDQVIVSHKISHKTPTKRGFKMEDDTTETPMFVGRGGRLTETAEPNRKGQNDLENLLPLTGESNG